MEITILGQTPAQKNSKNVGRNKYTGKTFVTSSDAVKEWQKYALEQLSSFKIEFRERIQIDYMFYVVNNNQRDLDNMVTSINDILQLANSDYAFNKKGKWKPVKGTGIIKGDNWQLLRLGSADAEIDKENPRAVLTITKLT